jgi:hypothetical protein
VLEGGQVAQHEIEVEVPAKVVLHKDVRFTIKSDGTKLGELRISKGTIDWRPGNKQKVIRMGWERFDRLMQDGA